MIAYQPGITGFDIEMYGALARIEPATAHGLSREAAVPPFTALAWLERHRRDGLVHRDHETGRYATWCPVPQADATLV